jgi:hypothetical protein
MIEIECNIVWSSPRTVLSFRQAMMDIEASPTRYSRTNNNSNPIILSSVSRM